MFDNKRNNRRFKINRGEFNPNIEVGKIYKGKVIKILTSGAFVEFPESPKKDGFVHISQLANERVEKVEDVLAIGDEVVVKVSDIDSQGRINLNMKDLEKSDKEEK